MNPPIHRSVSGQVIWTPELDRVLQAAAAQGHSRREIARMLGLQRNTVIGRLYRLGVGLTHGLPVDWTPAMDVQLRQLKRSGHSDREGAKAMGVTYYAFQQRRQKLGVYGPYATKPVVRAYKPPMKAAMPPKPIPQPKPKEPVVDPFRALADSTPVSIMDLQPSHCRWPIEGEVVTYCGCAKAPGDKSYCATHRTLSSGRGTEGERRAAKIARRISKFEFYASVAA